MAVTLPGGHGDVDGLVDVGQVEMPVLGGEDADLEEVTRAGPHLGVVGHQEQVGLGPLEDAGHGARHSRGVLQSGAHLGEVAHEGVVLGGQRGHQGVGRAGVDPAQGAVGGRCQPGQPAQFDDPVRPAAVGRLQHRMGLVDGVGTDPGHLARRRRQVLDRTQLPADHGDDVERGQQGRVQEAVGGVELLRPRPRRGSVADRSTTSDAERCALAWSTSAMP